MSHKRDKGAKLSHMLLLNTNRKSCMESPMALQLTLSDLERSKSRSHLELQEICALSAVY